MLQTSPPSLSQPSPGCRSRRGSGNDTPGRQGTRTLNIASETTPRQVQQWPCLVSRGACPSPPCPFLSTCSVARNGKKPRQVTESQNHRIVGVGRDLCGSSSPTLLLKQGQVLPLHATPASDFILSLRDALPPAEQLIRGAFLPPVPPEVRSRTVHNHYLLYDSVPRPRGQRPYFARSEVRLLLFACRRRTDCSSRY